MVTVNVDFTVDNTPNSVLMFLKRTEPIRQSGVGHWAINFTQDKFFGPDAIALLASEILLARKKGIQCNVLVPAGSSAFEKFLSDSGFRHLLHYAAPPTAHDVQNVMIPLQVNTTNSYAQSDPIVALVQRHASISSDVEEYLRICMNEIIQNVEDHAESSIGCVTCARVLTKRDEVRVAVVDRGRGIPSTLRSAYPSITSGVNALRLAIEGGYSAKSRRNNMGIGLNNLCNIVVQYLKGSLFILSENTYATGGNGKLPVAQPATTPFDGTAIFFSVPVH
jgi:hypothetical protein